MSLQDRREYYEHNESCDQKTFTEPNDRGLRTCLDCAGIFDEKGKGVAVTTSKLDENYIPGTGIS